MGFLKGKQGKDLIIIGVIGFFGIKLMQYMNGGASNKPIQKVTV